MVPMRFAVPLLLLALFAPLALAAVPPAPAAQALPTSATVSITIFTGYVAPVVVIPAGGSVSFSNIDFTGQHHTATSLDGSFDTGHVVPGQTVSRTFNTSGEHLFHCQIHPWMYGVLVVV